MSESDIVKDFLVESYENLDRLDRDLVGLEKNPKDKEALAGVFRTIHTIKGTCGFLGFNKLEKVAHVGENLLTRLRDGQMTLTPEITTPLLGMVDAIRQMLGSIEASGSEGERDDSELIATLTRLQQPPEVATKSQVAPAPESAPEAALPSNLGDILIQRAGVTPTEVQLAAKTQKEGDPRHLGEILVEQGAVRPADIVDALHVQQSSRAQTAASDSTIRVDVGLLDKVMNLVGELVLARNQILQFANRMKDTSFLAASQRLNLITTELQEGVMKTRMQPIGNIWGQFPRTVRDVALGCGKEVNIEMEGKETELDKTIIEAIKDPLTHLVRNSVDHGIELPEERVKAGKDRSGRLILRAFHEGGQVNIEISDDGAGLNPDRIRKKAAERAVITAEQAARMTEREIFNLIFLPGFSTAEKITNVSGRGVGMDVVKTNVEKIGGTVDVQSTLGRGTTVRVKIPLTLAIIPALVVTCGGDRYAIPQVSLLELVRLEPDEVAKGIEMVQGAPVHRLRGRLLPLVYLSRVLELAWVAEPQSRAGNAVNIVVLQAEGRPFGLDSGRAGPGAKGQCHQRAAGPRDGSEGTILGREKRREPANPSAVSNGQERAHGGSPFAGGAAGGVCQQQGGEHGRAAGGAVPRTDHAVDSHLRRGGTAGKRAWRNGRRRASPAAGRGLCRARAQRGPSGRAHPRHCRRGRGAGSYGRAGRDSGHGGSAAACD